MVEEKKIRYGFHIPIIIIMLSLQIFSSDIYLHFYLKKIESNLVKMDTVDGKLYRSGEYQPILKKNSSFEVPRDYVYVFVKEIGDMTKEVYYTKDGEKVEALYRGKRIKQISGESAPKTAYFIFPIIGFFLVLFANFREAARTGKFLSWQLGRSPDDTEKMCYLYGVPLFGIGILSVIVKEVWLK